MTRKRRMSLTAYALALAFVLSVFAPTKLTRAGDTALVVNGNLMENLSVPPMNIDNRIYVPAEEVFKAMGATVDLPTQNLMNIFYEGVAVVFEADSKFISINKEKKEMSLPTRIVNDKMMIPLHIVAEMLDFKVAWENNTIFVFGSGILPPPLADEKPTPPSVGDNPIDVFASMGPESDIAVDVSPHSIVSANFPKTKIIDISGKEYEYRIKASSEISRVDKFLLKDNRLVLDIFNAETTLGEKTLEIGNKYLSKIRTAQNSVAPVLITRVVFDLLKAVNFSVGISEDRTEIIVRLETNVVTDVRMWTDGTYDYVKIFGEKTPAINYFPLNEPNRLVMDLPLCSVGNFTQSLAGVLASGVRTSQFDANTGRIVLDLTEVSSFGVLVGEKSVTVIVSRPTFRNIDYSTASATLTIPKKKLPYIDISNILHEDKYDEFKYVLTLPGDFSEQLGYGEHLVKDNYINSVEIATKNSKTQLTFNENKIRAFKVTEDDNNIYVVSMLPKEMYKKILIIDPGHGGADPGTSGFGLVEKNINLDVAKRLVAALAKDNIKVYMTRTSDVYPTLKERVDFANELGDFFISIHHNAATLPTARGVEVFWHEHPLSMSYKSATAAAVVMQNWLEDLNAPKRRFESYDFYVVRYTQIPAILTEGGFLTNQAEADLLSTEAYRQTEAMSLYRSILKIFSTYTPAR